jgi:hypothetical protein
MIDETQLERSLIDDFNYSVQRRDYEYAIGDHSTGLFYCGYAKGLERALDKIREIKNL